MSNRVYETLVTKEDYLYYTGIDLDAELTTRVFNDIGDNPSPRFIFGVERWCKLQCKKPPYFWNGELTTEHQIELFKEGIIYQIQWILKNGTISNDSGYNMSAGTLISPEVLDKIGMSRDTKTCFRTAGIRNNWRQ